MGVINCIECGKLSVDNPNKLCGSCLRTFLDDEIKVAEYLRLHENSSIDEVHQATRVKTHIILKMIREGRIIEGHLTYLCENCSAMISSGRYCKNCADKVLETQTPPEDENDQETTEHNGMYITEILKKNSKKQY
jgi:hypothetical protein